MRTARARRLGDNAVVLGSFLASSRVACLFDVPTVAGELTVELSLNEGRAGTYSQDALPFAVYAPPAVTSVTPTEGPASGGEVVTIYGSGFEALGSSTVNDQLRCKFGDQVQVQPPLSFTDTTVVCLTSWGSGASTVSVALNGASFDTSSVLYTFIGLHEPTLLEVYVPIGEVSTLVLVFDSQPTDRAEMAGLGACSQVLDDATSAQLAGPDNPSAALCE